jgi:hypothetical protein
VPQHFQFVPLCHSQALPLFSVHFVGHWQLLLQTNCEQASQLPCLVAPGAQAPWPLHVPQLQFWPHVLVPQLPQLAVAPGWQVPWLPQVPNVPQVQSD